MKKYILFAIAIVIAGLMIAMSANAAMQVNTTVSTKKKTFFVNTSPSAFIAGMEMAELKGLVEPVEYSLALGATPVFPGYHPAVASDSLGYVVLGFEDDLPNVWFTASDDGGVNWAVDAIGWQIDPPPTLPDVDSCGDGRFIGGMVPDYLASDGSELYKVEVIDPMDLTSTGYSCPYWDWWDVGDGYTNFDSIAVAGYTAEDPDENLWAFGGHAITGDHGGESGDDTSFFSYQFDDTGYAWIYYWTGLNGCEDCAHDIDPGNLYSYPAWNFDNEGTMDIYVDIFDFGTWEPYQGYVIHPEIGGLTIETTGNDDYIDISALNDNVILVSQRDGDIVAYYSTNGMTTVMESAIETSAVNPRIVHTGDLEATCIFIKGASPGSVYYSTTDDGGATWGTPEEVEDSDYVPEEYKAADVCGFGAAWMNEDDGNIYFGGIGNAPPGAPVITGENNGNTGTEYEYTFAAVDPDGDDIAEYIVDWGDETGETITGPFASGAEATASHTWDEDGDYTITAKAKDINGLVGPEGTLIVTMPVNKPVVQGQTVYLQFVQMLQNLFGH